MAVVWLMYWAACALWFEDVQPFPSRSDGIEMASLPAPQSQSTPSRTWFGITPRQWGVIVTMCWFAMTCFFILGAWESNIPVFGASGPPPSPSPSSRSLFSYAAARLPFSPRAAHPLSPFHWSPFAAGNFIALGGAAIFPFLFLNLLLARRTQDRHILALGAALGFAGLLSALAILKIGPGALSYGTFFACWFLVALGFNLASTCTFSLLTKQLPQEWNMKTSIGM